VFLSLSTLASRCNKLSLTDDVVVDKTRYICSWKSLFSDEPRRYYLVTFTLAHIRLFTKAANWFVRIRLCRRGNIIGHD